MNVTECIKRALYRELDGIVDDAVIVVSELTDETKSFGVSVENVSYRESVKVLVIVSDILSQCLEDVGSALFVGQITELDVNISFFAMLDKV